MKIIRDIQKIQKKEYEKSINYLVSESSRIQFIKAIFLFGEIKFPGISDIDLLIVVSEGKFHQKKKRILEKIKNSSKYSDYLYFHDPIIVTELEAPFVKFFHTTYNLEKIYGRDIVFKKIKNPLIFKLWNSFFYRTYLNESMKKFVSERRLLLILNNLAESIRYNVSDEKGKEFEKRVNLVRLAVLQGEDKRSSEINLLKEGIEELKRIEKDFSKGVANILWDKKRSLFIPSKKLSLLDLKVFKIYFFPKYYFKYLKQYLEEITKFIKKNKLSKRDFIIMRKRFQSPSFFGY